MASRKKTLHVRLTEREYDAILSEAETLGFRLGESKVQLSRYVRWKLEHGISPIDRSDYKKMQVFAHDLSRLGSLFNQYMFHLNRELRILNDKGLYDDSVKSVIRDLKSANEKFEGLFDLVIDAHNMLLDTVAMESA